MANKQEALIYIEKDNITEAEFMSRSFVNKEIKNRAYINALGAELVTKYIASEGINIEEAHNIHSISKILEKIDIADILLPNIHIDVRTIFDENQIFVPKCHFDLEITPDIYVVIKLDSQFDHVELLGYFKPSQIDKKNANSDYYFISKSKLSSPDTLTKFIKDFTGRTSRELTQEDILRGRELSITLNDHDISDEEFRELLELLFLNDSLRESVLEFDNFETLAFNVESELGRNKAIETSTTTSENPLISQEEENAVNEEISLENTELGEDDILLDESFFDDDLDSDNEKQEQEQEEEQEENSTTQEETELTENDNTEPSDQEQILDEPSLDINNDNIEDTLTIADETETSLSEDNLDETSTQDSIETSVEEEALPTLNDESIDLGDDLLDDNLNLSDENSSDTTLETTLQEDLETSANEESLPILGEESIDLGDDLLDDGLTLDENNVTNTIDETSTLNEIETSVEEDILPTINDEDLNLGDDLLDDGLTIAAAEEEETQLNIEDTSTSINETTDTPKTSKKSVAESITDALKISMATTIETATTTAGAVAAEVAGAAVAGEKAASKEAIKLASVAGDLVNDIVNKNIEEQQKNLDRIDYAKTTTDATAVPENISALAHDLAIAKHESNIEAENSGKFDTPKDLSDLQPVDNTHEEVAVEQETIELDKMETIKTEEFKEDTDSIVNLESLTNIDSPTKPVDDLEKKLQNPDVDKIDLPNLSSFEINEDGTSSFDNFADIDLNNEEEHLVDLKMPSHEFNLDAPNSQDMGMSDFDNRNSSNNILSSDFGDKIIDQNATFEDDETREVPNFNLDDDINLNDEINLDEDVNTSTQISETNSNPENIDTISYTQAETQTTENNSDYSEIDDFSELLSDDDISDNFAQDNTTTPETLNQETDISNQNITPEDTQQDQDWLNDTNYDNLEDIDIPKSEPTAGNEISDEEIIVEPEANNQQKTFAVRENSRAISDKTFTVGEIPIDINNPEAQPSTVPENENLEDLYDPNSKVPGSSLLQQPGRLGASGISNAGLGIGIKLIGGLIVLAIVCAIGFGVAKLFKTPTEETPQPITDDTTPTSPDNGVSDANTLNVDPNNVVKMDNNTDALASTNTPQPAAKSAKQQTIPQATTQPKSTSLTPAQKKSISATTFIEVKKLTWEVPDYISYNAAFKQYFQAAGKSLKLSLTSDLLLATDYAYSNEIRVSVTFDKDGTFKTSQIITSSGSSQIDSIVLQTVNQTLKVLKAPHSVGNDESTTVILKIYL